MANVALNIRAYGKINLTLRVLGRRHDGFHDLVSWMQPIDWHDELAIQERDSEGVELSCDQPGLTTGPDNLIHRAINALATRLGRTPAFDIRLTKRLPVGGGLGGGSADAAAALIGMSRIWSISPDANHVREAAEEAGSDVPFFLGPGAAIVRGRGEIVERHSRPFSGWAALVIPPFGIATKSVFEALSQARRDVANQTTPAAVDSPWSTPWHDASELSTRLPNDLTAAACKVEPRLAELRHELERVAGATIHMSGSGSTLFALFDSRDEALEWQRRVHIAIGASCALRVLRVISEPPVQMEL